MQKFAVLISLMTLTASAGCQPAQSEACAKYVACQAHFEEVNELAATDLSESYGEGGSCWQNIEIADSCTNACELANTDLREQLEAAGQELGACE